MEVEPSQPWSEVRVSLSLSLCSQVTEETAEVVQSIGYGVTLRGVVNVKGKGELTTFFVNMDQSSPQF